MKFEEWLKVELEAKYLGKTIKYWNQVIKVNRITVELGIGPCVEVFLWEDDKKHGYVSPWDEMPIII
jgi:hypothetical protein